MSTTCGARRRTRGWWRCAHCRGRCIDACRGLAEHLRRAQPDFYRRTAEETEDALPDEVAAARAEDLGRIDTFEFEEKKVYEAALAALGEGRWEVARTWAQERLDGSSFWIELRGSLRPAGVGGRALGGHAGAGDRGGRARAGGGFAGGGGAAVCA
jgi:hypothetical protein